MPEQTRRPSHYDDVFCQVLKDVLASGQKVTGGKSLSVGSNQTTYEILNYSFCLPNPRDRLLFHPRRRLNLTAAIGRFTWMMSGSNLLSGIEFYDPKARDFSDDGVTVPGSSDGARLLRPRSGPNQIENVIELLKNDHSTRRAAVAIYAAEDAGRESRDIPCTMGLVFNIRLGGLHATTIMRSNNAVRVLPYDVFLFSLVAELVASAAGVPLSSYNHFAVSMHVYEKDVSLVREILVQPPLERKIMAAMPIWTAMEEVRRLVAFENELRSSCALLNEPELQTFNERIGKEYSTYWQDFARILLLNALRKSSLIVSKKELQADLCRALQEPWRSLMYSEIAHSRSD